MLLHSDCTQESLLPTYNVSWCRVVELMSPLCHSGLDILPTDRCRAAQYRFSCTPVQQRTAHVHKTILLGRTQLECIALPRFVLRCREGQAATICLMTGMVRAADALYCPTVLHTLPTVKCSFCIGQCTQHSATQFCTITLLFSIIKRKQCNSRF